MADASVLIVDDDEQVRAVLRDLLTEAGHDVATAPDGRTAVREAAARNFAVVLIDVHMPDQDGVQVLRELRVVAPDSRCVMISGVQDPELAQTCRRLGAMGFLSKPLRFEEVTQVVSDLAKPAGDRFSWEQGPETVAAAAPPGGPAAAAQPSAPGATTQPPDAAPGEGMRLRDPVAVLRSTDNGEVLARIACTVYAKLDAAGRSAREWRGVVDDFHLPVAPGATADRPLSGTLVLRDAVRGLFAGPAVVRESEIVANGPLRHTMPQVRPKLTVSTRKSAKDPSVTVIDLDGDLSAEHVEQFTEALREAVRAGRRRIVVRLDSLSAIDTTALQACLSLVPQLRGRNGDLKLAGATGDIWRVVESIGAHRTISCFATERDAVESFGR